MSKSKTNFGAHNATSDDAFDRSDVFFEMNQRKNEFLATLAHELRNPLAPLMNGLQLMAFMKLGDDAELVRAMMVRQVAQIVHLVDDLLDVARIGAGKVVLDKQVCMLSAIVDAAIEESSSLISEKGITLKVIDESESACVCGDASRLTQVVCNLLNNSARYGKSGGKILLKLTVGPGVLKISVQDDGIGIDADRFQDIFKMYSQIESAQGRGAAGLGIGLALVRNLVELHGGLVDVESEGRNCGSTFTVKLPLASGMASERATPNVASIHNSRSFRVLVVDDLRAIRIVTQQLLEKLGHDVRVAENGHDALDKLGSFMPDVVFSDITMPVMSGHEMARQIRQRPELDSICLVALTGYGQSSDRELAFEAGFDRHLTKPVDFQRLRELFGELEKSVVKSLDREVLVSDRRHQF
jgi:CheY-like chemotaxis protein/nitrogen-specific signal transduction histidine kinase